MSNLCHWRETPRPLKILDANRPRGRARDRKMELTMTFRLAIRIVGGLAAAAALSGCTGRYESTFAVVVENRVVNAIQVLADGKEIGQVASGQSGSFSLQLPESNTN